jgi:chitin synthase
MSEYNYDLHSQTSGENVSHQSVSPTTLPQQPQQPQLPSQLTLEQQQQQALQSWEKHLASTIRKRAKQGEGNSHRINATSLVTFPSRKAKFEDVSDSITLQRVKEREWLEGDAHPQKLAALAYFRMLRSGGTQTIVVGGCGEGRQRVLVNNLVLHQMLKVSSKKGQLSKTHLAVLKGNTVLQAFGCVSLDAETLVPACSFVNEVHFSTHGRTVGCRSLNYLLRQDAVHIPEKAKFLIFDLLLGDEHIVSTRPELRLRDRFKSHPKVTFTRVTNLQGVRTAMKAFGMGSASQDALFSLLASILHLGNLSFIQIDDKDSQVCIVEDPDKLSFIAKLLCVDEDQLLECFTQKTTIVKGERYTAILDVDAAAHQRNLLIDSLYSLLFAWVTEQVNRRLDNNREFSDTDTHTVVSDMMTNDGALNSDPTTTTSAHHNHTGPSITLVNPLPVSYEQSNSGRTLHDFCANYTNERLQHFINKRFFEDPALLLKRDNLAYNPAVYSSNKDVVSLMSRGKDCLMALLDNQTKRLLKGRVATQKELLAAFRVIHSGNPKLILPPEEQPPTSPHVNENEGDLEMSPVNVTQQTSLFQIHHFHSTVSYDPADFITDNTNTMSLDFAFMFLGDKNPDANPILRQIFADNSDYIAMEEKKVDGPAETEDPSMVMGVQQKIARMPSMRRPMVRESIMTEAIETSTAFLDDATERIFTTMQEESRTATEEELAAADRAAKKKITTFVSQFKSSLSAWFASMEQSVCWVIFCLDIEPKMKEVAILDQLRKLNIPHLSMAFFGVDYFISFTFADFVKRYNLLPLPKGSDPFTIVDSLIRLNEWNTPSEETNTPLACVGDRLVHLSLDIWHDLEVKLMEAEKKKKMLRHLDDNESVFSEALTHTSGMIAGPSGMIHAEDTGSVVGDVVGDMDIKPRVDSLRDMADEQKDQREKAKAEAKRSTGPSRERSQWVCLTWALTWWIPTFCIRECGGLSRPDMQMAWREKVALCILIALLGLFVIFLIAGLGFLLCPPQKVFTQEELAARTVKKEAFVYAYGVVYDVTNYAGVHELSAAVPAKELINLGGKDVSALFPFEAVMCAETDSERSTLKDVQIMNFNSTEKFNVRNPHRRPARALETMRTNNFKGDVVYSEKDLRNRINKGQGRWITYKGEVFDMTPFIQAQLSSEIVQAMFPGTFGQDLLSSPDKVDWTDYISKSENKARTLSCLQGLFRQGRIDPRSSVQCLIPNYLLLVSTCILVLLMLIKFLAALQFAPKRDPEDHDKFVICMIPCYTEDKDSLRKTINSLSTLKYDDKRKLLFIVCDGNIVGSGNDRPTPLMVLDILGVDPATPAPSLSFHSLGEGRRQYNMGKVYSGLYEVAGHVVPFVVVVKVGTPDEKSKPGNRGKRDSQLVLMRFLSKVAYDKPMSPMELEMYHHLHNIIGVAPASYEYVLMVDADTEVAPDALNRMVSCFAHDGKIMGLCGETKIANEKETWTTMIQVYEYYISHHLSKAFESLFGCVTCLPGCFCMYRIYAADTDQPLLSHEEILDAYAENDVDTLHKKNLLSLGEDRYLTTIMLKQFPQYKTVFTQDAFCKTNVPEYWSVFLSQRRRWINSTVHNLVELLSLKQLCGCCCFSMRFVVFLDLFATLILPATVVYMAYMIYLLLTQSGDLVVISVILMAVVYGLQAILFLIKRQWQHIAWMIIYILAIPVFNLFLPLYSFWHFDDFSWGNTRVVLGDAGNKKKKEMYDSTMTFDINEIVHKRWSEYEEELERLQEEANGDGDDDARSVTSQSSVWSGYGGRQVGGGYYGTAKSVASMGGQSGASSGYGAWQSGKRGSFVSVASSGVSGGYSVHHPPAYAALSPMSFHAPPLPPSGSMPSTTSPSLQQHLHSTIIRILDSADLMTITKKQVRDQLSHMFQQDLTPYRDFINQCIEQYLEHSASMN